ncbi:type IV pilus modification protein PilV [Ectothiorhodospira lacustris]|uniref:type IV pilus modification protein PilV n=1 Tax=Ectothiorhodospira lacustris TaxID=2899127 RepID=UPI001EE8717A|nr:type IV pilus modification protein PilV [Ectothiorhodospira lacustris]MCG5509818.1 type IV pilus modification protein PilV [Ectothiorhodospira lacustris]MCG5521071.1 type IV pilus modification protein PilV [Ectothiorhodospira lacustris]
MARAMIFPHPRMRCQRGLSLVEVMVAVVVLSMGLLGLAALQIKALQSGQSAYMRTVASVMAIDAGERLWALSAYKAPDAADITALETAWLSDWQGQDAGIFRLPGGMGSSLALDDGTYLVTVEWDEGRFAGDGEQQSSFSYRVNLLR